MQQTQQLEGTSLPALLTARRRIAIFREGLKAGLRQRTAPYRVLPDFLIIGAMKAGTTSLYRYLVEHPRVAGVREKELHYFDTENHTRGVDWYRSHFPLAATKFLSGALGRPILSGEASPYYLPHPATPVRAKALIPAAKLIVILRDPVDRAISHYNHQRKRGREELELAAAIEAEEGRLAGERERMLDDPDYYSWNYWGYSYLTRGRYAEQLEYWYQFFPREQFLVLSSEAFFADPAPVMDQVHAFLGLPEFRLEEYASYNVGRYSGRRNHAAVRERLKEYFKPHNARLAVLLGRDFGWDAA